MLSGMAISWPLAARAQKAIPVVGYLGAGSPGPSGPDVAAFREGLSETGYVDGQDVAIEYRWAEGNYDRLIALVADLVDRKVDLIAAQSTLSARAAKGATSTIPIVFTSGANPVAAGLIASLARPGGNLTGVRPRAHWLAFAPWRRKRIDLAFSGGFVLWAAMTSTLRSTRSATKAISRS